MKKLATFAATAILAACAHNVPRRAAIARPAPLEHPPPQVNEGGEHGATRADPPSATPPQDPERRHARAAGRLSLAWGNRGRGGAARRLPGYIHVFVPCRGDPCGDSERIDLSPAAREKGKKAMAAGGNAIVKAREALAAAQGACPPARTR